MRSLHEVVLHRLVGLGSRLHFSRTPGFRALAPSAIDQAGEFDLGAARFASMRGIVYQISDPVSVFGPLVSGERVSFPQTQCPVELSGFIQDRLGSHFRFLNRDYWGGLQWSNARG